MIGKNELTALAAAEHSAPAPALLAGGTVHLLKAEMPADRALLPLLRC